MWQSFPFRLHSVHALPWYTPEGSVQLVGYSAKPQEPVRFGVLLKDTDKDRVDTVILEQWDTLSKCQVTLLHIFVSQVSILHCCHSVLDPMVTSLLMFSVSHVLQWYFVFVLEQMPCVHMWNELPIIILFGPPSRAVFGPFFLRLYSLSGAPPLNCDSTGLAVPEAHTRKAI